MTHARGSIGFTGSNVGRICRVIRAYGEHTFFAGDTLFCWWIEVVGSPGRDANGIPCQEGHYPDAYLKRIDPPQEMVDELRREEIHA
jgi:hypothetical protein